jgi:biopolymer transport protein ExbD
VGASLGNGGGGSGRHRALAEINITPLVDVMLVLLIISMLAAPMLQKGIPLDLPATETAQDIRDPHTVVSLDRDGRLRLNDQPVHPDLLERRMKALATGSPTETVFLRADKLIPYEHPFLGILPLREGDGVRVRYVYPNSPAATAGVKEGDAIAGLGDTPVTDASQLRTLVANLEPKAKVTLKVQRQGETLALVLTPTKLPTDIPGPLPPATKEPLPPPADKPATGLVEIKLPEEKNECVAYVPENYHPLAAHGVLVVLSAPGPVDREKLSARWKALCEERQLIVLAPMSAAADKWQPTEIEFIKKTLDDVISHYNVDPTRIAVYGYQTGGAMAYLVGFEHAEHIRAIIAIEKGAEVVIEKYEQGIAYVKRWDEFMKS